MRIGIVAGEHSGDQLAADLIRALRTLVPTLQVEGIAGPLMIEAGCNAILPMAKIAYMGLAEIVKHLPAILKTRRQILQYFLQNPPDLFIGVDAPDFNLTLEAKLKRQHIKTIHYVSPSVWAWRQGRLKKIKRAVALMLTLLPFEARYYEQQQIPVKFVGHFLADQIPLETAMQPARIALNLPPTAKIIALLPGSRSNEIHYLGAIFLATAQQCLQRYPELIFIAPMINEQRRQQFTALWQKTAPELPLLIFTGQASQVMQAADLILLASGTATLEAMLFKKPIVVAYRMAKLSYLLAKRLVKTKFIALPNLLAGAQLVPEFIQDAATAATLSAALLDYLIHPAKITSLEQQFMALHQQLRLNASLHAAEAILAELTTASKGN